MLTLAFYLLCDIKPLVLNYWGNFVLQGIYGNIWRHFGFHSLGNGGTTSMQCVEFGVLLNIFQQKGQPSAQTCCLSHVLLFVTPQTVALLSMGFPKQEYGVGCHFLLQEIFLIQGSKPHLYVSCVGCQILQAKNSGSGSYFNFLSLFPPHFILGLFLQS